MADQILVFISHTAAMKNQPPGTSFVDGVEHAINAIDQAKAFHMAYFPAADVPPADYSIQQLRKAHLFVAVIGFDYGSRVRDDPTRSYTELEFDAATELHLTRLVFLLRPEAAYLQGLSPAQAMPQQQRFRVKLEKSGATVAYFDSVGDLQYRVQGAVNQWISGRREVPSYGRPLTSPSPPLARSGSGVAAPLGCLVLVLTVVLAAALVIWTAVGGSFPPWTAQAECQNASIDVVGTEPPGFGQKGAVLDIELKNSGDGVITVPASRDAIARGADGRQYATGTPGGDSSWFFDVAVQPRSSTRVGVAIEGSGSDSVTLTVPGVGGGGLPLTKCTLTSSPVDVTFTE